MAVFYGGIWVHFIVLVIGLCSDDGLSLQVIVVAVLSEVGTLCTAGFNVHKFYVLPTQCIYVFCVDLRTNSDYFPIRH